MPQKIWPMLGKNVIRLLNGYSCQDIDRDDLLLINNYLVRQLLITTVNMFFIL